MTNTISSLIINGIRTESPSVICNAIEDHFFSLFNKPSSSSISLNWDSLLPNKVTNPYSIEIPFSEVEIKHNAFSLPGEKSPGLDGFHLYFYHHFWDVLKADLLDVVQYFFHSNDLEALSCINQTFITLIPKKAKVEKIQEYRPISLLNSSYKIISKYLPLGSVPF